MLDDILLFPPLLLSSSLGRTSKRQPDCLSPLWRFISPTMHSPIYINESSTDWEIYGEKHDEIWRKEWGVERQRGSEVKREEARGGGRECANSCFLIKQQCSQLIHLICQLEEKHGRNLFTWERVGGGMKERKLHRKKSLKRRGIRGGIAEKGWGKIETESGKKDMNVVNRRRKMRGREDEKVKGRTRERGCRVAKPYYWPMSECDLCVCRGLNGRRANRWKGKKSTLTLSFAL